MSASVWQPGASSIAVNAENASLIQAFVATAGQTTFTLTQFTYVVGTGSIRIYRNGQKLPTSDVSEIDSTHFSLPTTVLSEGELIECSAVLGSQDAVTAAAISAAASAAEAAASAAVVNPANILYKADNLAGVADKAAARINLAVPQGYSSEIVGGSGALQVAGIDVMRFGSDTSGQLAGFRNKIINGDMRVAHVGSVPAVAGVYTYGGADHMCSSVNGLTSGTIAQLTDPNHVATGICGCAHSVYCSTNVAGVVLTQTRLEGADTRELNGREVVIRCYVYHDVGIPIDVSLSLAKANALDTFNNGANVTQLGITQISVPSGILTPISLKLTLGADDATNGLAATVVYSLYSAVTNKLFAVTDWQLELGDIPTLIEVPRFADSLLVCRRYCQILGGYTGQSYQYIGLTTAANTGIVMANILPMRGVITHTPVNAWNAITQAASAVINSATLAGYSSNSVTIALVAGTAPWSAGQPLLCTGTSILRSEL